MSNTPQGEFMEMEARHATGVYRKRDLMLVRVVDDVSHQLLSDRLNIDLLIRPGVGNQGAVKEHVMAVERKAVQNPTAGLNHPPGRQRDQDTGFVRAGQRLTILNRNGAFPVQ